MGASGLVWTLTIVLIAGLMLVDYVLHVRKTHVPTLRQAVIQSATFVGIAILFGIAVVVFGGSELAVEYFACYLTDEALSVDNLFVFLVIISSFGVPRLAQQKVLFSVSRLRSSRAPDSSSSAPRSSRTSTRPFTCSAWSYWSWRATSPDPPG